MNAIEKDEIHELRQEIAALRGYVENGTRWFIGLAVTVILTMGLWALNQHENNIRTNEIALEARKLAERNNMSIGNSDRQVSAITAKLEAQAAMLNRIDAAITELTRYLRGGPKP